MLRWLPVLLLVAACSSSSDEPAKAPEPAPTPSKRSSATPTRSPAPSPQATKSATRKTATPEQVDPRWRFFTDDATRYSSPWFAGRHRVMIGYGCTPAPYYDHDTRCPGRQGFHHGIDVAMPCGTPLFSAVRGVVLDPASSGSPGSAYGERPFRIRSDTYDVLIGHARRIFVEPGDRVRRGERIALASDSNAPDGCHMHFEVRSHGGGVSDAVNPADLLQLS